MEIVFVQQLGTAVDQHFSLDDATFQRSLESSRAGARGIERCGLVGVPDLAIFAHVETGEGKDDIEFVAPPGERRRIAGVGERHPYHKALLRKHNPLQAMAYRVLKLILFPDIWISGITYLLYGFCQELVLGRGWLEWVASVHIAAAYAILMFIIIHVYLLTTGHSFIDHVKPMITGWDEVDLSPEEEAYLLKDEPGRIR